MTGGTLVGYSSQIVGRRFSIIVMCVLGGAIVYPYTYVANKKVIAAAFFEQFAVQGAWGVIPIHLTELSPGAFRTFVVGTSYQLGNLVSSASSTIESTIGERYPLPPLPNGTARYEYGKVICIMMGAVYIYTMVVAFLGPEYLGRRLDAQADRDFEDAVGHDNIAKVLHHDDPAHNGNGSNNGAGDRKLVEKDLV
jgi:MFS transporter, SHS family, lactate transporter